MAKPFFLLSTVIPFGSYVMIHAPLHYTNKNVTPKTKQTKNKSYLEQTNRNLGSYPEDKTIKDHDK